MKKLVVGILAICMAFLSAGTVSAEITQTHKEELTDTVQYIQDATNNADAGAILQLVSPNAQETLRQEIQQNIGGKQITYQQEIDAFEELAPGKVKVTGKFAAEGLNWNISGTSNYFIFEDRGDNWYLLESDFAQKLNADYVFKFVGKIFLFLGPVMLLFMAFWIWMLVDVIKRPIENKTMWVLIIVLLGWIGAILYFFIGRRKHKKSAANGASVMPK